MQEDTYPCDDPVPIEHEPRHHLVIVNDFVRAFAVEIPPYDRTLCHHHAHEYLMYVAGIADIISAPRDQKPETSLYKDQECHLAPAGMIHVVENLTDATFRNILLEFLPKASGLRRGPDPRLGERRIARIRQRFDSRMVSAYVLSMLQSSEVEISGPAVLASPYGHEMELVELGGGITKLNKFEDLVWLRPSETGLVRSLATATARAVVFQLGMRDPQPSTVRKRTGEPLKRLRAHAESPRLTTPRSAPYTVLPSTARPKVFPAAPEASRRTTCWL